MARFLDDRPGSSLAVSLPGNRAGQPLTSKSSNVDGQNARLRGIARISADGHSAIAVLLA
jgi:hypothetical protein